MNLIQDLEIQAGTRVLLRCDLNLPQDENGNFTDFFRLESSLPTIEYLLDLGATIFITSHLGSPKGVANPKLSLKSLTQILQDQLDTSVKFIEDPFNDSHDLTNQQGVFLVENLRFWPGEEASDPNFAKDLINLTGADIFVQDAFGVAHRKHASLVRFPELIKSAAGILLQKEIQFLSEPDPKNLKLIVGGAKVESKLPVISNFIQKADSVLTGGVVANTFLKSKGENIASSLFEQSCLSLAQEILKKVEGSKTELFLPLDYLTSTSSDALLAQEASSANLSADQLILDLGQETIDNYIAKLKDAKTVVWAGTLGFAENPVFAQSSKKILQHLLELKSKNRDLKIIIGGGDTVDFARAALTPEEVSLITHLSTGGGASLLMLSGEKLPGIEALEAEPTKFLEQDLSKNKKVKPNSPNSTLGSKTPVLIANLKSHFNLQEMKEWLEQVLNSEVLTSPSLNFSIAPSDIFLEEVTSIIKESKLKNPPEILAQNISAYKEGAETGELAASQLKGVASGSIIGHSERRNLMPETNEVVFKKVVRAIESNLKVVLCVGGSSRDALAQKREVSSQLKHVLQSLDSLNEDSFVIAYEPVFAIGSGIIPSSDFLKAQLSSIRLMLEDSGLKPKVIYGGSVDQDNAKVILNLGFDGLLVGSASLTPRSLEHIGINITA